MTTFSGITDIPEARRNDGVLDADIDAFVREHGGGNARNIGVRTVGEVNLTSDRPFPFEKKRTLWNDDGTPKIAGGRGYVVWLLLQTSTGNKIMSLFDVNAAHRRIKASKFHALKDALNGGQSRSSKDTWGKNYVELFVIPKADVVADVVKVAAPKPKAKVKVDVKAKAKDVAPKVKFVDTPTKKTVSGSKMGTAVKFPSTIVPQPKPGLMPFVAAKK